MNRWKLLIVLIAPLTLGQMCGTPATSLYPKAEDLNSPIPEGTYAGNVTAKYSAGGGPATPPDKTITQTFQIGSDGFPLTKTNESIYVGYADSINYGGQIIASTVRSIQATAGGLTVDADITCTLQSDTEVMPLAGILSETFMLREAGTLDYHGSLYLAATIGTKFIWMGAEMSGTLSRNGASSSPSLQCLIIDDVISIPPGNATGMAFSGTYRGLSVVMESCTQCDKNTIPERNCNPPVLYPDKRMSAEQADGTLTLRDESGTAVGGINKDGTFRLGMIATPTNSEGTPTGQGLMLIEGQFVGNKIIATVTWRLTMNDTSGTTDLQAVNNVAYERVAPIELFYDGAVSFGPGIRGCVLVTLQAARRGVSSLDP